MWAHILNTFQASLEVEHVLLEQVENSYPPPSHAGPPHTSWHHGCIGVRLSRMELAACEKWQQIGWGEVWGENECTESETRAVWLEVSRTEVKYDRIWDAGIWINDTLEMINGGIEMGEDVSQSYIGGSDRLAPHRPMPATRQSWDRERTIHP